MSVTTPYQTLGNIRSAVVNDAKEASSTALITQINRWINEGYEQIALRKKWDWLDTQFAYTLNSAVQGVCTVTQGSKSVVFHSSGSAVKNITNMSLVFYNTGYNEIYNVSNINSATLTVTLAQPYTGTTSTSATGVVSIEQLTLDNSIKRIYQAYHQWISKPLVEVGPQQMRSVTEAFGPDIDYAEYATIFGQDGTGNKQMLIYPYPDVRYTLYIDANVWITQLSADTDQPLIPIQHRQVLYHYAMYKLWSYHRNDAKAQEYLSNYNNMLAAMEGEQKANMDYPQLKVSYPRGRKSNMFVNMFDKRLREYPS